jgi:hypothetical protein
MAELVDASDSKSDSARSAGSIPARGTIKAFIGVRISPQDPWFVLAFCGSASADVLTRPPPSFYVLMQIEAIGEALAASWRVHARCLEGTVDYTRSKAKCHYLAELGHETLVWARGRNMPLAGLRERMCPAVVGGPSAGLSRPRPPNSRRKRAAPPAEVAPKPYDAGGRLATAGGSKIRLTRPSPHPGHIPSVCWTCSECRVSPCDQSDISPASPTLTADTPSISLSLSTSLARDRPPRSSRTTATVPFDATGASSLGSRTAAVA